MCAHTSVAPPMPVIVRRTPRCLCNARRMVVCTSHCTTRILVSHACKRRCAVPHSCQSHHTVARRVAAGARTHRRRCSSRSQSSALKYPCLAGPSLCRHSRRGTSHGGARTSQCRLPVLWAQMVAAAAPLHALQHVACVCRARPLAPPRHRPFHVMAIECDTRRHSRRTTSHSSRRRTSARSVCPAVRASRTRFGRVPRHSAAMRNCVCRRPTSAPASPLYAPVHCAHWHEPPARYHTPSPAAHHPSLVSHTQAKRSCARRWSLVCGRRATVQVVARPHTMPHHMA